MDIEPIARAIDPAAISVDRHRGPEALARVHQFRIDQRLREVPAQTLADDEHRARDRADDVLARTGSR